MKKALQLCIIMSCFVLVMSLTSCGGGSSSSPDGSTSSTVHALGTVGILLTDSPADMSLFTSINATVESVALLGKDEEDTFTIYSGLTQTFDLLQLRNEAIPFTFNDHVPVGTYCKIRLTLSDLELVLADDTPADPTDNETYHPKLPGNGKLDLLARDCFAVGPGEVVTLQIDIDAGNSIHIVGNDNGYKFRPVVFVDVLNEDFAAKLVRLDGQITELNEEDGSLLLCDAIPRSYLDTMGCVEVRLGEDSAFFDNQEFAGLPRPLDALLAQERVGDRVTIVGWPHHRVEPHPYADVPEGHYPPPGECKLWNVNLDAGQQPAPIDCAEVPESLSEDILVVNHDGVVKEPYYPFMRLDALVVELGEFLQLDGEVLEDADTLGFPMEVLQGESVVTDAPLPVLFQEAPLGGNGTRIISKTGELLEYSDITAQRTVQVDGTLDLMNDSEDLLHAALVIVDMQATDIEQVTGTVLEVFDESLILDPDAESVCGETVEELAVSYSTETEILTVMIMEQNAEIIPGGSLESGQIIGMNGRCEATGYRAESIVIVDDQMPE